MTRVERETCVANPNETAPPNASSETSVANPNIIASYTRPSNARVCRLRFVMHVTYRASCVSLPPRSAKRPLQAQDPQVNRLAPATISQRIARRCARAQPISRIGPRPRNPAAAYDPLRVPRKTMLDDSRRARSHHSPRLPRETHAEQRQNARFTTLATRIHSPAPFPTPICIRHANCTSTMLLTHTSSTTPHVRHSKRQHTTQRNAHAATILHDCHAKPPRRTYQETPDTLQTRCTPPPNKLERCAAHFS